ncbi:MAG: gamma-glutamyltransferase [Bacteroidota bacterium]
MNRLFHRFLLGLLLAGLSPQVSAQSPIFSSRAIHHPIVAKQGMVASQHPLATEVGLRILQEGGNAVDAAVGVGFALAVVLPRAGNLGGGGFMLVHDAESGKTEAINYREMAPAAAHRDMYLDSTGQVDNARTNSSYQATGIPGTVAGLALALEKYGTMSLKEVLKPSIELAGKGFEVTYDLSRVLKALEKRIRKWPASEAIFYKGPEGFYEGGDVLIQKDLAWSLEQIAKGGAAAFYEGAVAEKIVADVQAHDGLITMEDMAAYKPQETEVVWGSFHGYDIASMPPPSSGGVHVIQMLNILEKYPLREMGHNSAAYLHLLTECMKIAYADRSQHLGDPLFWEVPKKGLTSKDYGDLLRAQIKTYAARPAAEIAPGNPKDFESEETTHFTVVDKEGNVVSNTYTLNFSFGIGAVAEGTGILLNNEMSDFSAKPGTPNAFGLLGAEANKVEPGKRPLSSMTPTIVFKDGKPFLATGSPGGSRIITAVLQVILNATVFEMNMAEATHAPRVHHQWYPDELFIEQALNYDTRAILESLGHKLTERNAMGSTQSIMLKDGLLYGASDPRRPDARTKGY